jgi:hypothetical protein
VADGTAPQVETESPDARPWTKLPRRGVGPVRCPACKAPVAEAERGQHACRCGKAEEGCSDAAKLRATLDGVAAEVDGIVARAAQLQVERDAALMALADEQEMARAEIDELRREPAGALMLEYRAEARSLDEENAELRAELAKARERIAALGKRELDLEDEVERIRFLSQEIEREFAPMNARDIGLALEELVRLRADPAAVGRESAA